MNFNIDSLGEAILLYVPRVIGAILVLIIGFWLISWVTKLVRRTFEKRNYDPSVTPFLTSIINVGLKVLLLISVAGMVGIETTAFIGIFSALALAVGLALQGNLGHFASGVLILIFKPFKVGHVISTQGYTGVVREIQVFNTIMTTVDNRVVVLPNGSVLGGPIENLSQLPERQLDLTMGIGYDDDIDKAREVLESVIQRTPGFIEEKGYVTKIKSLGDSSVNFVVRFWVPTPEFWNATFFMQEEVKKAFDAAGVGIPFPQMDVHVHQPAAQPVEATGEEV